MALVILSGTESPQLHMIYTSMDKFSYWKDLKQFSMDSDGLFTEWSSGGVIVYGFDSKLNRILSSLGYNQVSRDNFRFPETAAYDNLDYYPVNYTYFKRSNQITLVSEYDTLNLRVRAVLPMMLDDIIIKPL